MGLSKKLIQPPPSSAPKPAIDAYKSHARAHRANEARRAKPPLGKAPAVSAKPRGKPPSTKPRQLGKGPSKQVPRAGSPAAKTALKTAAGLKQHKKQQAITQAVKKVFRK